MNVNYYSQNNLNFIDAYNDCGLRVIFCDLGASIFNILFNNESMVRNVKDLEDFKRPDCYYGKTIGRTSGRLRGDEIVINDKRYKLEGNERGNVLHGGKAGFSNQRFTFRVEIFAEHIDVVFTYLSKDLEGGYPGNVNVEVRYVIHKKENRVDVIYNANSDQDTLLCMTNHSYFTLGDNSLTNLELKINAHTYLANDEKDMLPKGKEAVNRVLDFTEFKKICKDIEDPSLKGPAMNGYDNLYYLDEVNIEAINASLRNDRYQLDILSNYEGLVVYTSNYKPNFELNNKEQIRDSVALEPSDSLLDSHLLLKDHLYSRKISYIFKAL